MSDSDVLLDVFVIDQFAEIIIVDSSFNVIARGIHKIKLRVSPGIYCAKLQVGDQQSEKLFSVELNEPNNRKSIQLSPLEFTSPIPLEQTSTSREFHQNAIGNVTSTGGLTAELGEGSEVIIFLRDPSLIYFNLNPEQITIYTKNFEGFTLSTHDAKYTYPLESIGKIVSEQGYLIVRVKVNPGSYVLSRVLGGSERQCLPLIVPSRWSLQVFVTMLPSSDSNIIRYADFDGAAMVFDRLGIRFSPNRPDLKLLEVTRQALALGHNIFDPTATTKLLTEKFENPMLGLLVAHLLLLAKLPDLELIQKLVLRTSGLIGRDFPDLIILSWKIKQLKGTVDSTDADLLMKNILGLPLVQMSWQYLMEATSDLSIKEMLDERVSKVASKLVSSSVWTSWLDNSKYKLTSDIIGEDKLFDQAQVEFESTLSEAIGRSVSEASSRESDPSESSINFPNFKLRGFTGATRLSRDNVNDKGSGQSETSMDVISRELPSYQILQKEFPNLAEVHLGTSYRKTDTFKYIFEALVEKVDWKLVVRKLKSKTYNTGGERSSLTPTQRQLLLSLKAAREQFEEDDGSLKEEAVGIPNIPTMFNDLNLLYLIATKLNKENI